MSASDPIRPAPDAPAPGAPDTDAGGAHDARDRDARPRWRRTGIAGAAAAGAATARWPAVHVRGGEGPSVVVLARAGDPVVSAAVAALALELDPDRLRGRCTLVPACAPDDPVTGDALERGPLAGADLVLELGAGDDALLWSPAAIVRLAPDARLGAHGEARAEAAMVAFGAPESLRLHAGAEPGARAPAACAGGGPGAAAGPVGRAPVPGAPDIDLGEPAEAAAPRGPVAGAPPTLAERAARAGAAHVEVRCGSGPGADERLALVLAGCRNVLVSAGALDAPLELRATRHLEFGPHGRAGAGGAPGIPGATGAQTGATVLAGASGTLAMAVAPGGDVHAGSPLARLTDPARPDAEPAELLAPCDGTLLACRPDGPVGPGDRIALIAEQIQP